jgi:hypothetical protein
LQSQNGTFLPIGKDITRRNTCLYKASHQIAKGKLFAIRYDFGMFIPAEHALFLFMPPQDFRGIFHASGSPLDQKIVVE